MKYFIIVAAGIMMWGFIVHKYLEVQHTTTTPWETTIVPHHALPDSLIITPAPLTPAPNPHPIIRRPNTPEIEA